jgi:hypothetical protein
MNLIGPSGLGDSGRARSRIFLAFFAVTLAVGEPLMQRFTFFNLDSNHVRQLQEQSSDGGKTWSVVYDFYYARKTT